MRKLYFKVFTSLLIIAGLTGCKLDPPIYPANSTTTQTGTPGETLIKNGSTITYNVNGNITTLTMTAFQVMAADTSTIPDGNTQIMGGTTPEGGFSLSFSNNKAGTYDIDVLYLNSMLGDNGKVTVTQLNTTDGFHGTIKGTFTTDLLNISTGETITGVTGTFDITL
jgi:hypothetical protein